MKQVRTGRHHASRETILAWANVVFVCAGLHQLRGDVGKPTVKLVRYLEHAYGKLATSDLHETHEEVVDDV